MTRKAVDNFRLERWRGLHAAVLLPLLADFAKQDANFRPIKEPGTTRWHVSAGGSDFELVCTGPRFLDTRARTGGAGAVDLVSHLWNLQFRNAIRMLEERGI
ncbi:hypothetical protein [Variovorax gossypii]|jgi:hypothetical protein